MEARLFEEGAVPEWATAEWYDGRDTAPHLDQPGHRERLLLTADLCHEVRIRGATTACDLGAGDGGLLSLLKPAFTDVWGYDLQRSNVTAAEVRNVNVSYLDVTRYPWHVGELTIACEFLEHLVDPHGMVGTIHAKGARFLIASSPYTETRESHYPFHLWVWDEAGYRRMLEANGWTVIKQERAWICQVLLCERS